MRIGVLINLAPSKLGSLENWMVELAEESARRGHAIDIYGRLPIHPAVAASLHQAGARFMTTDELEAAPVAAVRKLGGYDVLQLNLFQPRTNVAMLCYAAWPAKIVLVDHTSGREPPQMLPLKAAVSEALDRLSLARVDGLIGVSEYVRQRDILRFGLSPNRTRTVHNGVDVTRFAPLEKSQEGQPVRIVAVAHLIREKGIDVLLKAVSRLKRRPTLTIVGDGPQFDELKRIASELRVSAEFTGIRDDHPETIGRADILVHPARWEEAFGLTVVEGMSASCAVVASCVGGIPEIVEHQRSGLLFPKGDELALSAILERLGTERELRRALGSEARKRALERFTLHQCVTGHLNYLEEVAYAGQPELPSARGSVGRNVVRDASRGAPLRASPELQRAEREAQTEARRAELEMSDPPAPRF